MPVASTEPASAPLEAAREDTHPHASDVLAELKPKWRGWIHLVMVPFAIAGGIVLICLAPTGIDKVTSAVYALTAVLLFSISATYHRWNWSPKVKAVLKRLDHTNILLLIAGTYTPLSVTLLPSDKASILLWVIWSATIAGITFRLLWHHAPRWLYVPIYVMLGCAALLFIPDFFAASIPAAILICVGGAMYIAGAVFYALKRPNFSPTWFGFHELFHAFTVGGFVCHYIAVMFAVLSNH